MASAQTIDPPVTVRPAQATIVTTRGEMVPSQQGAPAGIMRRLGVTLTTPYSLDEAGATEAPFTFRTEEAQIDLHDVKALVFWQESTNWIGSAAPGLEWYRLGTAGSAAPPPAGWARQAGDNRAWSRGVPVDPGVNSPYIQKAQSVWAAPPELGERARGEFLTRGPLAVEDVQDVERARLRIASSAEVLEIRLNDKVVRTGGLEPGQIGVYEVTPLLHGAANMIGIWLRTAEGVTARPWVAFHLELTQAGGSLGPSRADPRQAIVFGHNGTRMHADIERFGSQDLWLTTNYGSWALPWQEVRAVAFPWGWMDLDRKPESAARRVLNLIPGMREPAPPLPEPQGLPFEFMPPVQEQFILPREGEPVVADAIRPAAGVLELEGTAGGPGSLPMEEIAAIYPGVPERAVEVWRPTGPLAPLYCRLRTTAGEELPGLLREVQSRRIVLETEDGGFLRFEPEQVTWIWFPQHTYRRADETAAGAKTAATVPGEARLGAVAILGRAGGGSEADQREFERLNAQVQSAAFKAEIPTETLTQDALTQEGVLSPLLYPVVVAIDPAGEYLDTWEREGDVRDALLDYVERGGTLLAYSRRGAFTLPVLNMNGKLLRNVGGRNLARDLGFQAVAPGSSGAGAQAFHQPPNLPVTMLFRLGVEAPAALEGLPEVIYLPSMLDAAFYPMVDDDPQTQVVYELRTEQGRRYGPALSVHRRGAGRVVLVDHLLWKSDVESQPFVEVVLPHLMQWLMSSAGAATAGGPAAR